MLMETVRLYSGAHINIQQQTCGPANSGLEHVFLTL